jgi:predicted nuclease with TOPRIM domain
MINWDLVLRIAAIVAACLAALPGIYSIRRQLKTERLEQRKLIVEAESLSAEVAAKLIDSAGDLQTFYEKLFEELKKQLEETRELICRLEGKIDILTEENIELKKRVEELEKGIEILTKQILDVGLEPRYKRRK